jgi:glycosyltransferase involved in cell wall biosynthesis
LAAGRPIIASLDGEGARVIEDAGAGVCCPAEDAEALAQAVRGLRALPPEQRQRMGEAGRCYYEQHFDPGRLALQLVEQFETAITGKGQGKN